MGKNDITELCDKCGGSGFEEGFDNSIPPNPVQIDCKKCSVPGKLIISQLSQDLIDDIESIKDNVDDIKDKVNDIKEKIDEM